jgi:tetratricopeptide (TPR) repeat protein
VRSEVEAVASSSQSEQLSKAARKRQFSTTMAVIQEDPTDVRARLQLVDLLQQDGRTADAVEELQRTAAVYVHRGVPIKAVAVLRQAVKLAPDRADVRVTYGEVFEKLRMNDDAAREYRAAIEQFHANGEYAAEIETLACLVLLDEDNHGATIAVAEALHRVGRTERAAEIFRGLAERLLENGSISEWEMIAERLCFLAPDDATTAHDLALHYVRSDRHAEALGKLICCYEDEPKDVELFELIIDTLQHLGQTQHAAAMTKQLVNRYQRGGLQSEAEDALRRLHELDPDDEQARRFLGVLDGAIAGDSVLELQASDDLLSLDDVAEDEDDKVGFGGDFIDHLLTASVNKSAPVLRPSGTVPAIPVESVPPIPASVVGDEAGAPPLPEQGRAVRQDVAPPLPTSTELTAAQPPKLDEETKLLEVIPLAGNRAAQPMAGAFENQPAAPVPLSGDAPPRSARDVPLARPKKAVAKSRTGTITTRAKLNSSRRVRPAVPAASTLHGDLESAGFGLPMDVDADGATEMLDTVSKGTAPRPRNVRSAQMPRRRATGSITAPPRASKSAVAKSVASRAAKPTAAKPSVTARASAQRPAVPRPSALAATDLPPAIPTAGSTSVGKPRRSSGISALASAAERPKSPRSGRPSGQQAVAPPADETTADRREHNGGRSDQPPPISAVGGIYAAPKAPTSTENTNLFLLEEDEEAGFGAEPEHTTIDPRVFEVLDQLDAHSPPAQSSGPAAEAGTASSDAAPSEIASSDATRSNAAPVELPKTIPVMLSETRTLTPKRRSTKLPRPRLTRGRRRSASDSLRKRGIETDLKTLDFFIERGFYESAAALVGELEKRYPQNAELRARRQRIAQMGKK